MASHTPERWDQAVSDGLDEAFRIERIRAHAPELLAALEACERELEVIDLVGAGDARKALLVARAAIRQARGE